jgi:hypothetical protein
MQVGKIIIEDVLLDGRASVNIITENLRTKLSLPKPRPTPYHLKMLDQCIRINGESKPEQGISDQRVTKTIEFNVTLETSLEDKDYLETYYHHNQADIEVDETPTKIQV